LQFFGLHRAHLLVFRFCTWTCAPRAIAFVLWPIGRPYSMTGAPFATGIYFARLDVDGHTDDQKILVLR
jgi:hypothetical protein